MASVQSSQDIWRSRDPQPKTKKSQPPHRSESRWLSDRRRPMKAVARKRDRCPGALHEGDAVHVFSRSFEKWVVGEVVKPMEGNFVRVEYEANELWFGKCMHVHSEHLIVLTATAAPQSKEKEFFFRGYPGAPVELESCTSSTYQSGSVMHSLNSELESALCEAQEFPSAEQEDLPKPLMQGCHGAGGYGNLSPEDKYIKLTFLWRMLDSRDVILIKGSWLLELHRQGGVLPCRQELPAEAIWNPEELRQRTNNNKVFCRANEVAFLSVSHCWYSWDHPDPKGEQVQDIGPFLEDFLRQYAFADLAIFWCWCSFFQNRREVLRTVGEQKAFDRSFPYMDLFYTNENFIVWMLTKVPCDADNTVPYHGRGWTTWESIVANMLPLQLSKLPRAFLVRGLHRGPFDLSVIENKGNCRWMVPEGPSAAALPLSPDRFAILMTTKHFTKGKTDLNAVIENYRNNFWNVMSVMRRLDLVGASLACEGEYLRQIIQGAPCLRMVSLCWCSGIGHAELNEFMKAPQVKTLHFNDCTIGDVGAEMIAAILVECPHVSLLLNNCGIGNAGVKALAATPDQCHIHVLHHTGGPCLLLKKDGMTLCMQALADQVAGVSACNTDSNRRPLHR